MAKNEKSRDNVPDIDVVRVIESHKTIRIALVCITILGSIAMMVYAYCKVAHPGWIPTAIAFTLPSSVTAAAIRLYGRYVKKNHGRMQALETAHDPGRTSSDPIAATTRKRVANPPVVTYGSGEPQGVETQAISRKETE